jgi:hypothetical protein
MERLSEINNDKHWLVGIWYLGFALFALGAAILLVLTVIDLIQRFGVRDIGGWLFMAGCGLLIAATAIDVPMAYIRRRRKNATKTS